MNLFRRIRKQPVEVAIQTESHYHTVFPNIGTYEETIWYADNEKYAQAITICLSVQDWSEFASQEFFQKMFEYLHSQGIQSIPDKHRKDEAI